MHVFLEKETYYCNQFQMEYENNKKWQHPDIAKIAVSRFYGFLRSTPRAQNFTVIQIPR